MGTDVPSPLEVGGCAPFWENVLIFGENGAFRCIFTLSSTYNCAPSQFRLSVYLHVLHTGGSVKNGTS